MQLIVRTKSKKRISDRLKTAKVNRSYFDQEELNMKAYISQGKEEKRSITMSNEKYHKSFSL